jgi:hypothetical protein
MDFDAECDVNLDNLLGHLIRAFSDAKRFTAADLEHLAASQEGDGSRYGAFLAGALKLLADGRLTIRASDDGERLRDWLEGQHLNNDCKRGPNQCVACGIAWPGTQEDQRAIHAKETMIARMKRVGWPDSDAEKIWRIAAGPRCPDCARLVEPFLPGKLSLVKKKPAKAGRVMEEVW